MWRGLLAGAFWGGLVGVLVLVVAALTLEERKVAQTPPGVAESPSLPVSLPRSPDTAPPLPGGHAHLTVSPPQVAPFRAVTQADARGLLPRPGKPPLPDLVAGGPLPSGPELPQLLPEPVTPVALPAGPAVTGIIPTVVPQPLGDDGAAALDVPHDVAAAAPSPRRPVTVAPPLKPAPLEEPGPLILAADAPQGATPPVDAAAPEVAVPAAALVRRAAAPGHPAGADTPTHPTEPAQAANADILASPLRAGPRIAFILAAQTAPVSAAVPDWVMTDQGVDVAPFQAVLVTDAEPQSGRPQIFAAGSGRAFAEARATGRRDALLAYARLNTAAEATPQTLRRIAARARRDGAVTVIIGADPALWAVLEIWLGAQASDLVSTPAVALLP